MKQNIAEQYKTADNLNIRRLVHEKYSTNQQPFEEWIMSHYDLADGCRILELGCGTGQIWKGRLGILPVNSQLILSDFSTGMLESSKINLGEHPAITYQQIDIQQIPYPDVSFDVVIANMMLYHVPDLHKALSEVRRVLKPGGSFYCATYGEHGIMEYIREVMPDLQFDRQAYLAFTLQNGRSFLEAFFDSVKMRVRDDGLAITCVDDFVDYILSMSSLTGMGNHCRDSLYQAFAARMIDGILYVPKEYGIFICK